MYSVKYGSNFDIFWEKNILIGEFWLNSDWNRYKRCVWYCLNILKYFRFYFVCMVLGFEFVLLYI